MLKKIMSLLIISSFLAPCHAYENYMLMTDKKVTNIKVSNEDVITVKPIVSLNCDGNSMMIIPRSVGRSNLSFCKGKKRIKLWVIVKANKTCIKKVNGVKVVPMGLPPELIN